MTRLNEREMSLVNGGALDDSAKRAIDLMIRLFKADGAKMEQVYQIPNLPDEQREYIRSRWYKL